MYLKIIDEIIVINDIMSLGKIEEYGYYSKGFSIETDMKVIHVTYETLALVSNIGTMDDLLALNNKDYLLNLCEKQLTEVREEIKKHMNLTVEFKLLRK